MRSEAWCSTTLRKGKAITLILGSGGQGVPFVMYTRTRSKSVGNTLGLDMTHAIHSLRQLLCHRFVFEKPFGRDAESCAELVNDLSLLPPRNVFWMDHYLGKELVMNLLVLRFANIAFGALWNRHAIKAVQVGCLLTQFTRLF